MHSATAAAHVGHTNPADWPSPPVLQSQFHVNLTAAHSPTTATAAATAKKRLLSE